MRRLVEVRITVEIARVLVLAPLFSPGLLLAQRETETTRTSVERLSGALLVKGSGDGTQVPRIDGLAGIPTGLTSQQLMALLAPLGLSSPPVGQPLWEVTPGMLYAPRSVPIVNLLAEGRAMLGFKNVGNVGPAVANLEGNGIAELWVRPAVTGRYYMIDCRVSASGGYSFSGAGRSTTFTNTSSLIAMYLATDQSWAKFQIKRDGSADPWTFYSCRMGIL